ncbi:MAG: bacteriophage abortive infection AbiH family protein [Clostridiales bacterium]|nr:bacteriophage abortive infection AbiH family protein [Clostridiales bacterium]
MKKVTFFVGNGFDCKNNLKTGYSDFLDWYIKHTDGDTENIIHFKHCIKENEGKDADSGKYGVWSYLEKQMGQYDPGDVDVFIDCYDDIYSKICEYILEQDTTKYNNDKNQGRNKRLLPEGFKKFLRYFYRVKTDKSEYDSISKELEKELFVFNFISLNYTELLPDCVDLMRKENFSEDAVKYFKVDEVRIGDCLCPHGKLPDIVFGVSDESQVKNKEFLLHDNYKKRMLKCERVKDLRKDWFDKCYELISESDIICLFGLSVGETDNHWWKAVVNWLNSDQKHITLIYKYENDEKKHAQIKKDILYRFDSFSNNGKVSDRVLITFDEIKFAEMFVMASIKSRLFHGSSVVPTVTKD